MSTPDPGLTGFPYPPLPAAGSNAIGLFSIGVGVIGDIRPFDWRVTVVSQYANSTRLTTLIQNFDDYVDQTANISSFYDNIMNLDTAVGYGLDVWGRIVGIDRVLLIAAGAWFGFQEALPESLTFADAGPVSYLPAFGFAEAHEDTFGYPPSGSGSPFGLHKTFTHPVASAGVFYNGQPTLQNYTLSDLQYRTLIYAKSRSNITDCSIPSINQTLVDLFPNRGNCYVTDGLKAVPYFGFAEAGDTQPFNQAQFYGGQLISRMSIQYVFDFALDPVELAIVENSGVVPKPAGVASTVIASLSSHAGLDSVF